MCVLASLLIPICYGLGKAVGETRAGLLSAAAAVIFPNWLFYSGAILSDLPAACLIGITAWLSIEAWKRKTAWLYVGAGISLGLAALVRPTCLAFAPVLGIWILCVTRGFRQAVRYILAIWISVAGIAGSWFLRNSVICGHLLGLSSQGGYTLWIGNNPNATGILSSDLAYFDNISPKVFPYPRYRTDRERAAATEADARRFILENPGRFLWLCGAKFIQLWKVFSPRVSLLDNVLTLASLGVLLPFFLLRLFGFAWRRAPDMLFALLIATQTLIHCVYTAIVRYRIPVEPLLVAMSIMGVCWVYDRLRRAGGLKVQPAL